MADRIGVINKGELIVVEEKATLMKKLGRKQLSVQLAEPMTGIPPDLAGWKLSLGAKGCELHYSFDGRDENNGIPGLLRRLGHGLMLGIAYKDPEHPPVLAGGHLREPGH